jgi:hypothetical protein
MDRLAGDRNVDWTLAVGCGSSTVYHSFETCGGHRAGCGEGPSRSELWPRKKKDVSMATEGNV